MKKRVREEVTPIPSIYTEELGRLRTGDNQELSDEVAKSSPTYYNIKSGLYKQRRKNLPPIPKTRADIQLIGDWTKSTTGDDFILIDNGIDDRMIVFGTEKNLQLMCDTGKIFCDGTFATSPSQFSQLYTIHGFVNNQMFPLIFALLPDKSQATYERLFRALKEKAASIGLNLLPTSIQLDFETAVHNAVSNVFPDIEIKGCYFHFTQCIWRRIQKLGLSSEYKSKTDLYKFVRRMAVLPLVPLSNIDDVFLESMTESPDSASSFADYFVETWFEGAFPPIIWNHHNTDGPRTTNHLEGWHNKLKSMSKKSHPNIYEFINTIKLEQAANEVKMLQLEGGAEPPKKKRKYKRVEHQLVEMKQKLDAGEYSLMNFADLCSNLLTF